MRRARFVAVLAVVVVGGAAAWWVESGDRPVREEPPRARQEGSTDARAPLPAPGKPKLTGAERRAYKTTMHRDRGQWMRRALEDDQGEVPPQAVIRGKEAYDALREGGGRTALAGLSLSQWTSIGPLGIGGRIRAIAWQPGSPAVLWIGGVAGGLWHSENRGGSWTPASDFLPSLAVSSIVVDPLDPSRLWVGTGESFSAIGVAGAGVLMSSDSGITWNVLPSTETWTYVNRLAISPDGLVLLAAVEGGPQGDGIYRSTDSGQSWTLRVSGIFGDVDFHPTDSNRVVAGVRAAGGPSQSVQPVMRSGDGGLNWSGASGILRARTGPNGAGTFVTSTTQRVETAWAMGGGEVYASVFAFTGGTTFQTGGLYRSTDSGATFVARNIPAGEPGGPVGNGAEFLGGIGDYANVVWVGLAFGKDVAPVIVGGVDLFKSTDRGETLTPITDWRNAAPNPGDSVHADHHAIVPDPNYDGSFFGNNRVYFGNDGGIYVAENILTAGSDPDREDGWTCINGNLGITQFYAMDVGGAVGNVRLIGGCQDNGTLYFRDDDGVLDPDRDWFRAFGGDGGGCALDHADAERFYGTVQYGDDVFASTIATYPSPSGWLGNVRDLDGADRGNPPAARLAPFVIPDIQSIQPALTPFILTGFALDPGAVQTLLVGCNSLWRTRDARTPPPPDGTGPTWAAIKPPASPNPQVPDLIKVVEIDPSNPDRVWVGHVSGKLYRSENATAAVPTWEQIGPVVSIGSLATGATTGTSSWPTRALTGIVVNPADGAHVAVTFGGYTAPNLWQTFDGGDTWFPSNALPELPVWDAEIHPDRRDSVYLATELGVLASWDRGRTWTAPAAGFDGPAATRVTDLAWLGRRLYAATFGRGVFRQRVERAGPPLLSAVGSRKVIGSGSGGLVPFSLDVSHDSPPPDGEPGLDALRTLVWSNQRGKEGDAVAESATKLAFASEDEGTTPLGRVYLMLVEGKDAAGTPGWTVASAVVPRDAKVSTLLGLLAKATRDEMALAHGAAQAAVLAGNKSGGGDGTPDEYEFLATGN